MRRMSNDAARYLTVRLEHATVRRGARAVLRDVSWTLRPGERWLLARRKHQPRLVVANTDPHDANIAAWLADQRRDRQCLLRRQHRAHRRRRGPEGGDVLVDVCGSPRRRRQEPHHRRRRGNVRLIEDLEKPVDAKLTLDAPRRENVDTL